MSFFLLLLSGACSSGAGQPNVIDSGNGRPFFPQEGEWSFASTQIINSNTSCAFVQQELPPALVIEAFQLRQEEEVAFSLIEEQEQKVINCTLQEQHSEQPLFVCTQESKNVVLEDIEDADVEVLAFSAISGFFHSETEMVATIDFEIHCLYVDHWFGLDCEDITPFFSSPCRIQVESTVSNIVE